LQPKKQKDMSRICQITGKKVMVGNNVSHAKNKTKRRFYPNLQTKKFFVPETGETVILKVSANAIRTIDKKGIAAVLATAKANGNILV
jgi:large subunit ribosomal protein L28